MSLNNHGFCDILNPLRIGGAESMQVLCYSKCSTCRTALKWLDEQGVAYDLRDIKTDNPTEAELRAWHAQSGLPLKRFFNTSGLQYRALELKDRLPSMSEQEQFLLLVLE
jgi:arsenate reductase